MVRSGGVWCGEVWHNAEWFLLGSIPEQRLCPSGLGFGVARFGSVGFGPVRYNAEWLFLGSIPRQRLRPSGFWCGEVW